MFILIKMINQYIRKQFHMVLSLYEIQKVIFRYQVSKPDFDI